MQEKLIIATHNARRLMRLMSNVETKILRRLVEMHEYPEVRQSNGILITVGHG